MNQQMSELKQQFDQEKQRRVAAETECAKLKEVISRYQTQQKRMSPGSNGLFRPIASPVVARKRVSQTDFLSHKPPTPQNQTFDAFSPRYIYRVSHIEMRYYRRQKKIENEQFLNILNCSNFEFSLIT